MTLYNLVTGRLPFEAENIYLLFQTIGKGTFTIPTELDAQLTSLLTGLLHTDKRQRLAMEQIKQHDWFRRRPPRTFEQLPIPRLTLDRFQAFTMYDYLTELHQTSADESNDGQPVKPTDGFQALHKHPYGGGEQQRFTTLNCSCSRTVSGETLPQIKSRQRDQHRLCSLS